MNEALGKKPPKLCTDMPNCDCKDGEHYRKSLLELANEIKEVNYKFISKTFLISRFKELAKQARISAGEVEK